VNSHSVTSWKVCILNATSSGSGWKGKQLLVMSSYLVYYNYYVCNLLKLMSPEGIFSLFWGGDCRL